MNNLNKSLLLIGIAAIGCQAHVANAASFNCNKAGNAIEKAICGDAKLSKLDEDLSEKYNARRKSLSKEGAEQLRSEQLAWLKDRNTRCNAEVACLSSAYTGRIAALSTDKSASPAKQQANATSGQNVLEIGPSCPDISVTSIKSKEALFKFVGALKSASAAKDADAVTKLVIFPLRVGASPPYVVKDAAALKQKFSLIFNDGVLKEIAAQKSEEIFCRDLGAMMGKGGVNVWIDQKGDKVGIISINL